MGVQLRQRQPIDQPVHVKRFLVETSGVSFRLHDWRRQLAQVYVEELELDPYVAEATLSHALPNVNKAYQKSNFIKRRMEAAELYADFLRKVSCCGLTGNAPSDGKMSNPINQFLQENDIPPYDETPGSPYQLWLAAKPRQLAAVPEPRP